MDVSALGYGNNLFILPFDHRSSFEAGLLGIRGRPATPEEVEQLSAYKQVTYEGFLQGLVEGVPSDIAAILVDQKYGEKILADANQRGVTTCTSVEKSGQAEFDFEYGDDFGKRLRDAAPTFAKALVRYNPAGDAQGNENQRRRLKVLSDHAHSEGYKFMFELLVPATPVNWSRWDKTARLMTGTFARVWWCSRFESFKMRKSSRMSGSWNGWTTGRRRGTW